MPKYAIFWHIFTISMKDILYITLKAQAAQNFSIQNDLKNKNNKINDRPKPDKLDRFHQPCPIPIIATGNEWAAKLEIGWV